MRCKRCRTEKDASAFYVSNKTRCKECVKESVNTHRQANLEAIRAYDRLRGGLAHRVAARKEYMRTPQGKLAHKKALVVSSIKFPGRAKARYTLSNAIRDKKVVAWPCCAVPECARKPEGHHPDYSQPLSVVWLCNPHHREVHALTAELEAA